MKPEYEASSNFLVSVLDRKFSHNFYNVLLKPFGYSVHHSREVDEVIERLLKPRVSQPDVLIFNPDGLPNWDDIYRTPTAAAILAILSDSSEQNVIMHLNAGATSVVSIPFYPLEIVYRVRRISQTSYCSFIEPITNAESPGLIKTGSGEETQIDLIRRRTFVGNTSVELTLKEWALLRLLAQNAGQVVSYREIESKMWGDYPPENALRVTLSRLRKKLGDNNNGHHHTVATVHNQGLQLLGYTA